MILCYAAASADDARSVPPPAPRAHARGRMAVLYEHVGSPPARTTDNVLAFGRTLCRIWSHCPVLPMQFGCTADSEAHLDRWLDDHGEAWSARLAELAGRVEVILHVPAPATETPATRSGQRPSGRDYLLARARTSAQEDAITADARRLFAQWTQTWRALPSVRPGERRLAFLVPQEVPSEARAVVDAWSRDRPGVQLSGPWPPFSFCQEAAP
jgi:Gas vesicle synthesis protein GvpL/GvpF